MKLRLSFFSGISIVIGILISCNNQNKPKAKETLSEKELVSKLESKTEVPSKVNNCKFSYVEIDKRTYNTNHIPSRYQVGGVYNVKNDFIDIEIPVSITDYDLCSIKNNILKINISKTKKYQALVLNLTKGDNSYTIPPATHVIKGRISLSNLGFDMKDLQNQGNKIMVYTIHDECYSKNYKEIKKSLIKDLQLYYKNNQRRNIILSNTINEIDNIRDQCGNKIKPFAKPRESGGGVITGG